MAEGKVTNMFVKKGDIWAGTVESLSHVSDLSVTHLDKMMAMKAEVESEGGSPDSAYYSVTDGGTAVISIKGPLLNYDIPPEVAGYYGVTCYPNLQKAFALVSTDERVKQVVLDVDSGGGAVSGIHETCKALDELKGKMAVHTFAGEGMYSGAVWLGSAGETVTMSEVGGAGSIGVIMTHLSYKAMYENDGITPTVMRAGKYKALGQPLEEFTEEAKVSIQKRLDFVYDNFKKTVAKNRGVSVSLVGTSMAEGLCFYGEEAVEVGLVDKLGTFESLISSLEQPFTRSHVNDNGRTTASNGENTMTIEELQARIGELEQEGADKDGKFNAQAADLEAANQSLAAATAEVGRLQTQVTTLTDSLTAANANVTDFGATLDVNIKTLSVALNAECIVPADVAGKKQLHAQLQEKFQAAFPNGQVTISGAKPEGTTASLPDWAASLQRKRGA